MLYIASVSDTRSDDARGMPTNAQALTPTPVSHTVKADDFTSPGTTSLIIAKPDRVEVWDATETGLTSRGELVTWGTVAGLATVTVSVSQPLPLLISP